jgi:hypothetical protein
MAPAAEPRPRSIERDEESMDNHINSLRERRPITVRRLLARSLFLSVLLVPTIFLPLAYLSRPEQLESFRVGPWTINVYAEGPFHYEPPGYIYFELKQWGQTRIPERRFMGIGGERKPSDRFGLISTPGDEVVALVLNNEVQMIHEFSSGYTWPGPYTNVTEPQWQMAELLLQRLRASNPEITCPHQDWYRRDLDRRRR